MAKNIEWRGELSAVSGFIPVAGHSGSVRSVTGSDVVKRRGSGGGHEESGGGMAGQRLSGQRLYADHRAEAALWTAALRCDGIE